MTASIWNPDGTQEVPQLPAVSPVTFVKGSAATPGINFVGDTNTGIWSSADGNINFSVNGVNALTVDPSGNVIANKLVSGVELDLASATTCNIGAQITNTLRITGTSNITSFGTTYRGPMFIRFAGALTLTHNSSTLILPGAANISVLAGDTCIAVPKATAGVADGWVVIGYSSPAPLLNAVTSINGGQLGGLLNRIINGGCSVAQRGNSVNITAGTSVMNYGAIDRLFVWGLGATLNTQQVAGSGTSQYRMLISGAAGLTSFGFGQRVESNNSYDMNSKSVVFAVDLASNSLTTLTWVASYANTADTFGTIGTPTKTQIATGTFTINSTVSRYTSPVLAIPAAATTGIEIAFSGGALGAGATVTVGALQLELGSVATVFEQRQIGPELSLCQRYTHVIPCASTLGITIFVNASTTSALGWYKLPVTMRVAPTLSYLGANSVNYVGQTGSGVTTIAITVTGDPMNQVTFIVPGTGFTAGQASFVTATASLTGLVLSSEL